MSRFLLVLDPQNSDATFGSADEAEIWEVDADADVWHTETAKEEGHVKERVSVGELIEAAQAVVKDAPRSWFGDTSSVRRLQALLDKLSSF